MDYRFEGYCQDKMVQPTSWGGKKVLCNCEEILNYYFEKVKFRSVCHSNKTLLEKKPLYVYNKSIFSYRSQYTVLLMKLWGRNFLTNLYC